MHRIDSTTAALALPAPRAEGTPGFFTNGDPAVGRVPTTITFEWLNAQQEELIAILTAAGIVPNKATNTQVLAALEILFPSAASFAQIIAQIAAVATAGAGAPTAWNGGNAAQLATAIAELIAVPQAQLANVVTAGGGVYNPTEADQVANAIAALITHGVSFAEGQLAALVAAAGNGPYSAAIANQIAIAVEILIADAVPAGTVAHFAGLTAPANWLPANGAAVPRVVYASLFAAIGTTFGAGDGATTFGLPDLRGEFIRGFDSGRGVDSGRAYGSEQLDALQGHFHSMSTVVGQAGGSGSWNVPAGSNNPGVTATTGPISDGANGTPRTAAESRPRNVALLACIKF